MESKKKELKEEYFDIEKRYKIELIRVKVRSDKPENGPAQSFVADDCTVQTTEAANEDLAKYAKALDA